jgi:lipoic acid synthetase
VTAFAGKPEWLRVKLPSGPNYVSLKNLVKDLSLNTVCVEARCPNIEECWNGGTATFMLMGDTCTRACRFCSVKSGKPDLALDQLEPEHVAEAVVKLNLTYVVLTSVNRDDLSKGVVDGGASHFAKTVRAIKSRDQEILVETLIPDFNGDPNALDIIIDSGAEVIAQNMETVHRLTKKVRDPRSGYEKTLSVLEYIKLKKDSLFTKSSLMLGIGEEDHEIFETMDDLRSVGVDILTLGQYLQPTKKHLPVKEYLHPARFDYLAAVGREKGFAFVAAGPLIRSSYRAGEFFIEHLVRKRGIRNGGGLHG